MLFQRLILCALLVGLCSGLVHSAIQRWQVVPLILAAEGFESAAEGAPLGHGDGHAHDNGHGHDHGDWAAAWRPDDGLERTGWTVIANVLSGIGYALLLLPLMAWWDQRRGGQAASWRTGVAWGAAGWLCLFALPALGLPPELPGSATAALQARQAWWVLAAVCGAAALGLACLGGARLGPWRWLGAALPVLPFAVGAPRHEGSLFPGQGADAALQLQALGERFIVATALATAVYWLVLGALAGAVVARWLRPLLAGAAGGTPAMEAR